MCPGFGSRYADSLRKKYRVCLIGHHSNATAALAVVCVCARARVLTPHGLSLDQKFGSKTILIAVKNSDQDLNSHATSPSSVFSSCTFLTLYAAWRPGRTIALLACGASC